MWFGRPRTDRLRATDRMRPTRPAGSIGSTGPTPTSGSMPSTGSMPSPSSMPSAGRMPSGGRRSLNARQRLARRARWRRWWAALLAAVAAAVTLSTLAPRATESSGREVLVAVRDLPAGAVVTRDDVEVVRRPASTVPETGLTAYADVVGRTTATALSTRDVVTSERLIGAALLAGQPAGSVAMSVPVLDVGQATRRVVGARRGLVAAALGGARRR